LRKLIDHRLNATAASELVNAAVGLHIDEDTIAAFVEGRLRDDECQPVVSHLAACGLCRRTSAQFVRLENQVDEAALPELEREGPGALEAVLARLRSAIPSANEEVVFAYQNPEEGEDREKPNADATEFDDGGTT
jgi:anti-sigma factor ChrR (cupin superfamily)